MQNKLVWLLFAISCFLLLSCAVVPPDVPAFEHYGQRLAQDPVTDHMVLLPSPECMEMIGEFECGHGVYIMSGKEIYVGENKEHWFNGKPWSQLRRESIMLPAQESYAPLSTYIINSCAKANCNDQVDQFKVRFDEFRGINTIIEKP